MHELDYYELLGVAKTASATEIRVAYRRLAKTMHPDAGGSSDRFGLLQIAYETLSDPVNRTYYDRELDDRQRGTVPGNSNYSTTSVRSKTRRPAFRRTRTVGDDPSFIPVVPDLAPEIIPWWNLSETRLPPTRENQSPCGDAPALAVLGGIALLSLPILTPITWSFTWIVFAAALSGVIAWLARRHLIANRAEHELISEFGGEVIFGRP